MKRSFRSKILLLSLLLTLLSFVIADQGSNPDATSVNSTAGTEQGSCSATDDTCTTGGATTATMTEENVASEEEEEEEELLATCVDLAEECKELVDYGECETHPVYMVENCAKSCQACFDDASLDLEKGEDVGVLQSVDEDTPDNVRQAIATAREYIRGTVYQQSKYDRVKRVCRAQHEGCAYWSTLGECEANPTYMNISCAPYCQTCEYLDIRTRCPIDPNLTKTNIWQPGDLNKMFERVTTLPEFQKYEPVVVSRPELLPYDTIENATYQLGPWVVLLEHVITPQEADVLIQLGAEEGYERSSDVGALQFDGTHGALVNEGRTSTNAWCTEKCYQDPVAKSIIDRIEYITQIPDNNTEFLQLLRYDVGQHYQTHHDLIEYETEEQDGVRILTFYMYLNDVEAGGGTNFPTLNLTVTPKRGRAVMWPSVMNDNPDKIDQRTEHQALPVEKGIKYGANAWFHQRDFKTPHAAGCLP